jgi:hypothetical protein
MENPAPPYPVQSVDHVLRLLLMLKRDGVLRVSDVAGWPTHDLRICSTTACAHQNRMFTLLSWV